MNNSHRLQPEILQDRFGLKVAAQLSASIDALPHDITERLRAARHQALARRKQLKLAPANAVLASGSTATLGSDGEHFGWWGRLGLALPLLALAIGLVAINHVENDNSARELAAVDVALLVDDLPPAAYTDPGFAQFVKLSHKTK